MKALFNTVSLFVVSAVTAVSMPASALTKSYCDDLERLDNLYHLTPHQFKNFFIDGTKLDRIIISKTRKKLYVLRDDVVLKTYDVAFGSNPFGHKQFEGDKKTPEGVYKIDGKNAESLFYKGLHIDYPNKADRAYAKSKGRSAGGDIMIHGFPNDPTQNSLVSAVHPFYNWTSGCIAVTNTEIDEIFSMAGKGTPVEICKMPPPAEPGPIDPTNPPEQ